MIDKPGLYPDFDVARYHADPCPIASLTQSVAKLLLERSPAHAKLAHPRLSQPEPAEEREPYVAAQAIGNAVHAAMTGRGKTIYVAPFDSWRTKEAQAARADAEGAGKIAILEKHHQRAQAMVQAASWQLGAAGHEEAFRLGHGEVVLAWREGGIWLRTMIDWLVDTTRLYDFKTSGMSCAPHVVVERPSLENWDLQAAMHERALDALDPDNAGRRRHYYVAQENEPPYGLTVVEISEHDLTMGRKKLAIAIDIWRDCITSGIWPLYPPETVISRPRGWTESKWLERELDHEESRSRRKSMLVDLRGG